MHKDTRALPEKNDAHLHRNGKAGHATQFRYDSPASRDKTSSSSRKRVVLVAAISDDTAGVGAACVQQLVQAGHRVLTILPGESEPHVLADAIASGRAVRLSEKVVDSAHIQSAIKSLPPPYCALDAVVNIMQWPSARIALLGAEAPLAEANRSMLCAKLLDTNRAALPSLLASECGRVVEVRLHVQPDNAVVAHSHTDAPYAALRHEFDALGIGYTRITAGPMKGEAATNRHQGKRPSFNGVQPGVLLPGDVAQAIEWTLSQPDHVAVPDITVRATPRARPVLSQREREVLEWTACGKTAEEISRILELSVRTVNFHVNSLVLKLKCCNKTAAVVRAALLGMLA